MLRMGNLGIAFSVAELILVIAGVISVTAIGVNLFEEWRWPDFSVPKPIPKMPTENMYEKLNTEEIDEAERRNSLN